MGAGHGAVSSTPRIDLIQKVAFVQRPVHTGVSCTGQGPSTGMSQVRACAGALGSGGPARPVRAVSPSPTRPPATSTTTS